MQEERKRCQKQHIQRGKGESKKEGRGKFNRRVMREVNEKIDGYERRGRSEEGVGRRRRRKMRYKCGRGRGETGTEPNVQREGEKRNK